MPMNNDYITRKIEPLLTKALSQFPVCMITGPRQAGKSTLLQHHLKKYTYVSLDDPAIRDMAVNDPELFLAHHKRPLIIDEIQYAPDLLSYIKIQVDQDRHNYGQFVLTGSQTFQVMNGVSESLAGRVAVFHLYPLTFEEVDPNSQEIFDPEYMSKMLVKGFYPELSRSRNIDIGLWISSYFSMYIERDVRNIKNISDLNRFQNICKFVSY